MKNEDELFRETTLKICGNLEIDEALHELLRCLQEVMPVSKIYLQHCDDYLHTVRTIAYSGRMDRLRFSASVSRNINFHDSGNRPRRTLAAVV